MTSDPEITEACAKFCGLEHFVSYDIPPRVMITSGEHAVRHFNPLHNRDRSCLSSVEGEG